MAEQPGTTSTASTATRNHVHAITRVYGRAEPTGVMGSVTMAHRIRVIVALATALALGCPPPLTGASPAATVTAVSEADLGATWRPECPVRPAHLRRVEVSYTGFDGQLRRGALVVHRNVVEDVIAIFDELQKLHYPIQRMQTVDRYQGADDELSMEDNNTSAFNCRRLPGSAEWSPHAFGRAIDVNPLINPYLDAGGDLQPVTAARYLDRGRDDAGILRADSPAVRAFTDRGWRWGGGWRNPVDYQHFEVG